MSDRAALAALSAHFAPAQVAADLARYSPDEVWQQRARLDNTGRLARYRPEHELSSRQVTDRAKAFATAVAEAGHTVAATLAYGVDAAAHQAAKLVGGTTLAVLPRGLDRAYPHTHAALLNSVSENGGAVVSLFPPGTEASGTRLKASAALLATLSHAVLLIEALDHTEALRTAEAAIAIKRTLLAVPGDGSVRSEGNARLLAEQLALPCPDPARALELL